MDSVAVPGLCCLVQRLDHMQPSGGSSLVQRLDEMKASGCSSSVQLMIIVKGDLNR